MEIVRPACTGECETAQGCACFKRPACDCAADVEDDDDRGEPLTRLAAVCMLASYAFSACLTCWVLYELYQLVVAIGARWS